MSEPDVAAEEGEPRAAPTALEWVALVAGLVLTLAYAWTLDDAFVYYRYVDNLLFLGRGLVFNEGEYVEGFTSPVWAWILIALRSLELNYWLIVRLLGLACFVLFWWLLVRTNRALSPAPDPTHGPRAVLDFPVLFLSVNYGVLCYFTSGIETPLVQVAAAAFALHLLRPELRLPQVLLGLAPMIRHELALPFLIAVVWTRWRTGRLPRLAVIVAAVTSLGWMLFRVWYYADLLPNTFYLKDQVHLDWGLAYLHDTLLPYGGYLLIPLFAVLAIVLHRRGLPLQLGARAMMLLAALGITVYVVKIGGDGRHYRYLAFPFVVSACAAGGLTEHALAAFAPRLSRRALTAAGAGLLVVFGWLHPVQLSGHPLSPSITEERHGLIRDAEYHRQQPDLAASPWSLTDGIELLEAYRSYRAAPPEGPPLTASDSWCVRMFERFPERLVHLDALTDKIAAYLAAEPWRPGHRDVPDKARAAELARIQREYERWGPGLYRQAVQDGKAPEWIARNLETIEQLERKVYNRHRWGENLRAALTFPDRIQP